MKLNKILTGLLLLSLTLLVTSDTKAQEGAQLLSKTVQIDSAALKTSFTTEVTLIKAVPGAYIVPVSVAAEFLYTDAYSEGGGTSTIIYAGGSTTIADLSTMLAGTANNLSLIHI